MNMMQAGALSEEQFAENLEKDLNSPHQPNLLPFLKVCVYFIIIQLHISYVCYASYWVSLSRNHCIYLHLR